MTNVLQCCLTSLAVSWDSASWNILGRLVGCSGYDEVGYHTAVPRNSQALPFCRAAPKTCWVQTVPVATSMGKGDRGVLE